MLSQNKTLIIRYLQYEFVYLYLLGKTEMAMQLVTTKGKQKEID